jgi:carbon monoxide dehydrogenase subunit G
MRVRVNERRGAVAVLVAVCLVAIVGVVGLVLDGGMLRDQRRRVQASADAAALAAAYDLYWNYARYGGADIGGTAQQSAFTTAAANGHTNDGTVSVVTVNIPPVSGQFAGKSGHAEVIVQYNQRRGFSGVFGRGNLPVRGRAVARGIWSSFNSGIIVLNPTDPASLDSNGGATVTVKNASIIVNSTDAAGGVVTGGGAISAPEIYFGGSPGYSVSGGSGGTFDATIYSNQPPTPDPLAYLPEPDPSTMTIRQKNKLQISGSKTVTLYPGVYKGGISITGQAEVVLMPGIYYMDGGGFSYGGQGSLTAEGVMIYNAPTSSSDVINIGGLGTVKISPMTSGTYAGITFFQQRSSTNTISVSGNGGMNITGTFYAAGGDLKITGNGGGDLLGSQYISYNLDLGGNGNVYIDWNPEKTAKQRHVGLVE